MGCVGELLEPFQCDGSPSAFLWGCALRNSRLREERRAEKRSCEAENHSAHRPSEDLTPSSIVIRNLTIRTIDFKGKPRGVTVVVHR